jgi:aminopeptidase N
VPSLLRGFSAPVILERADDAGERVFLLAHDTDPFNKWEAGRKSMLILLAAMSEDASLEPGEDLLLALAAVADDPALDPAFKALALALPTDEEVIAHMAAQGRVPDPPAVWEARRRLEAAAARALGTRPAALYAANAVEGPYSPDAASAGKRALRTRALGLLTALDPGAAQARGQFAAAGNMTERMAALALLVAYGRAEQALAEFHAAWAHDRLVVDKWFSVQAAGTPPDRAVATIEALTRHPDFDWKNPNRLRALIGAFATANPAGFHAADGSGYRLLVDWLIRLDPVNPQTTARLAATFGNWRIFDAGRRRLIRGELERLAALPRLSRDTSEIVGRLLRDAEG